MLPRKFGYSCFESLECVCVKEISAEILGNPISLIFKASSMFGFFLKRALENEILQPEGN